MTEQVAWSAVVLAGLTAIGTAFNTYWQYREKRDKLVHDAQLAEAVSIANAKTKALEDHHVECSGKTQRLEDNVTRLQREVQECSDDRSRIWDELIKLKG